MSTAQKETVFLKLINEHQRIIFKICRHYCLDPHYRQDLAQEILAVLWNAYDSYTGKSKFSTWMYKVALNTAITYSRKESKRPKTEVLSYSLEFTQDQELNRDEDMIKLDKAIMNLNKADKAILILYLEGKIYEEIAELIGITRNNIGVKIKKIKDKLRTLMKEPNG